MFDAVESVTVQGAQTSYWSLGPKTAVPVIFVHGFRGDHHGLALIIEAAARIFDNSQSEYRLVIPDLPGFGESTVMDAPHTLAKFGTWLASFASQVAGERQYHLVAHSFGTLVTSAALAAGATPATVTLINPISAPALEGPQKIATQAAVAYYKAGAALPEKVANALLSNPLVVRCMSEIMAKTPDSNLRGWIHQQHAQYFSRFADRNSLLEAFKASISHTVAEFAPSFSMPTQLIVGNRDDITPLTAQLKLAKQLADAKIHIIGGVGHLVHYEAPVEAAEVLTQFILQADTARSNA